MSRYYNRNNRGITKKLGPVTAYADAVLAGYTGTREQWAQDMAKLGQNVTQVAQNTKLTTELAEQTRVNTEQVAKDTADVRRLAEETRDNAVQVASNTAESNRLAEETKQAAAQAKVDAEYAGAAADNFRVDTTLSEEGKAAEAKTTGEKFAQLSEEIDVVKKHVAPKVVAVEPDGFNWKNSPLHGRIITDYRGKVVVDYDAAKNAVTGKTYYVDPVNGRYDNDGLTPETPLKSMADAYSRNDISVMMLANGLYAIQHSLRDVIVKKDLSIIGMGDEVYVTSHSASEFTKSSSYNNVYQSTRGFITGVVDMSVKDVYGDWMQYTQVSTIDNVTEVAGSYAHISGVVYVHTVDNRIPDADLLLFAGGSNIAMSGGHTLYLENLKVIEGVNPLLVTDNGSGSHPKVYAKNCTFAYSAYQSGDAVSLQGVEIAVFQNCTAKHAKKDGFNYHALNGVIPKAIEIGCTAYGCGYATDNDDQGSTIHDGGKIIRVNGNYFGNRSGNIADESEGTQSWNIGCVSHDSNGGSGGYNANFFCYPGVEMWLDNCIGFGSEINCYVSEGGKIYTRFNRFSGALSYPTQTERIEEY